MRYKAEEWVKIDVQLANKLNELKKLDGERDDIISQANELKELTPVIRTKMNKNLAKYQSIAKEVAALKLQANALKHAKTTK